mgnify:CR=1 FL=1
MKYNPEIHHRRSIRLPGYDYSQAGMYFVTICTQNRECAFGKIVHGKMEPNISGEIVTDEWKKTAEIRKQITLDEWIVMPNHFHGIVGVNIGKSTARRASTVERFGHPVSGSIPTIVRSFKSAVTKRINELNQTPGKKLWQRNYWEHIVRSKSELDRIREYIRNNPVQWELDRLHPDQPGWDGRGTARRAPTGIREPSVEYGQSKHPENLNGKVSMI